MFEDFDNMAEEGRALTRFGLMQKLQNELEMVERQLEEIESPNARRRAQKSASSVALGSGRDDGVGSGNERGSGRSLGHSMSLPAGVKVSKTSRKRNSIQKAQKFGATMKRQQKKSKRSGGKRAKSAPRHRIYDSPETVSVMSPSAEVEAHEKKSNKKSRPKSSPAQSKLGASAQHGGIAGYTQPGLNVDDRYLRKAKDISSSASGLELLLRGAEVKRSCLRLGITPKELMPKSLQDFHIVQDGFQKRILDGTLMQVRYDHYERKRLEKLAAVLQESEVLSRGGGETNSASHPDVKRVVGAAILEEEQRQVRVEKARKRINEVLEKENSALQRRRLNFAAKREQDRERERELREAKEKAHKEMRKRAKEKQKALDRVKEERDKREQMRINRVREQMREKEKKASELRKKKRVENDKKGERQRRAQQRRQAIKEEVARTRRRRAQQIKDEMRQREKMIAEAKAKAARKAAIRKEEQMLLMQDKLENVERIRRMSEYKRQQIAQKISQDDERTTKMGSLKRAIADERLKSRTRELVAKHRAREGVTIERELLPGPGEYTIKTTLNVDRGYKIGEENPKSDIEWIQYRASQIPGPGAYKDVSIKASSPTIKFSLADVPSDLELRMRRAPLTPGPDEYNPGQAFRADTPSFSMGNFRPKTEIEWVQHRARKLPAPWSYQKQDDKSRVPLRKLAREVGTTFNQHNE